VTITLSYGDAASLSKGELSPADALNAGRVRVRGDLSVLVAAQNLLTATRTASGASLPPTTY
jgi:putative sterol carrier protein